MTATGGSTLVSASGGFLSSVHMKNSFVIRSSRSPRCHRPWVCAHKSKSAPALLIKKCRAPPAGIAYFVFGSGPLAPPLDKQISQPQNNDMPSSLDGALRAIEIF